MTRIKRSHIIDYNFCFINTSKLNLKNKKKVTNSNLKSTVRYILHCEKLPTLAPSIYYLSTIQLLFIYFFNNSII